MQFQAPTSGFIGGQPVFQRQSNLYVTPPPQSYGIPNANIYPQQSRFGTNNNVRVGQIPIQRPTLLGLSGINSPSTFNNIQNPTGIFPTSTIPPSAIGSRIQPGILGGYSSPMFNGSRISSQPNQNWSYQSSMRPSADTNIDTTIIPEKVYCVICDKNYQVTQCQSHIQLHKKPQKRQGNKIKKLPDYTVQNNDPQIRPIVQPEQYNIQYNPNQFILEKVVNFSTLPVLPVPEPIQPMRSQIAVGVSPNDFRSNTNIQRPPALSNPVPIYEKIPVQAVSPINSPNIVQNPNSPILPLIQTSPTIVPAPFRPETIRLTNQHQSINSINYNQLQGGRNFAQDTQPQRQSPIFGQGAHIERRQQRDTFLSDRPSSVVQPISSNPLFNRQTIQSHEFVGSQQGSKIYNASNNFNSNIMPIISEEPQNSRASSQMNQSAQRQSNMQEVQLRSSNVSNSHPNDPVHTRTTIFGTQEIVNNPLDVSQTIIQQQSNYSNIPQENLSNQNSVRVSSQNQLSNTSGAQGTANQNRDVSYYNPPADTHLSSSDYSKSPDDKIVPRQLKNVQRSTFSQPAPNTSIVQPIQSHSSYIPPTATDTKTNTNNIFGLVNNSYQQPLSPQQNSSNPIQQAQPINVSHQNSVHSSQQPVQPVNQSFHESVNQNTQRQDSSHNNLPLDGSQISGYSKGPDDKIIPRQSRSPLPQPRETTTSNNNIPQATSDKPQVNYFPFSNPAQNPLLQNTSNAERNTNLSAPNHNLQTNPQVNNAENIMTSSRATSNNIQNNFQPGYSTPVRSTSQNIVQQPKNTWVHFPPPSPRMNPLQSQPIMNQNSVQRQTTNVVNEPIISRPAENTVYGTSHENIVIPNTTNTVQPTNIQNIQQPTTTSNPLSPQNLPRSPTKQEIPQSNINDKSTARFPQIESINNQKPNLLPQSSITQPYQINLDTPPLPILQQSGGGGIFESFKKKKLPKSIGGW